MMKNKWIKKGDKVIVIAGNDKGTVGEVMRRNEDRIVVQGVNIRKKHMKSRDQNQKSEIISIEMPVHISNVSLCTPDGKRLKLGVKQEKDGNKELVNTGSEQGEVHRTLRKSKK